MTLFRSEREFSYRVDVNSSTTSQSFLFDIALHYTIHWSNLPVATAALVIYVNSCFISNLHRQGYRKVKLHVILVGLMGNYLQKTYRQTLADLYLGCHKIYKLTHKLNEHSIRHASTLIKTRYALQYNLNSGAALGDPRSILPYYYILAHTAIHA